MTFPGKPIANIGHTTGYATGHTVENLQHQVSKTTSVLYTMSWIVR